MTAVGEAMRRAMGVPDPEPLPSARPRRKAARSMLLMRLGQDRVAVEPWRVGVHRDDLTFRCDCGGLVEVIQDDPYTSAHPFWVECDSCDRIGYESAITVARSI